MEKFELIGQKIKEIKIRGKFVPFDNNYKNYEKVEVKIRNEDNHKKLIGFGDLIRYLHETNPPSQQKTYKLLAKILMTRDTANCKPTQKANNIWKNWESGNL